MSYLEPEPSPFHNTLHHIDNPPSSTARHQMPHQHYPDHYPQHQPQLIPPSPSAQPHPYPAGNDPMHLPEVGQTRCYWTLLSSDLQFIYLDPVLAYHLREQAELLIGKSLLSFVHPDEQASAKQDLGNVLDSRTLHGSVTRVRFSRLSSVRRQLGYEGPQDPWSDADKVSLDSNYMAVDIVINWAAEGLVLCFLHAIVDLTPNDNDESNKTEWTNWCGTPLMSPDQIELLYRRLLLCIPRPGTMTRVFQILGHHQGRPLLLSWPPDLDSGPTGIDFAKLVENVQIGTGVPNGNDAKTSCTRRYKALQNMPSIVGGEVESIFIPHGSIIFACHKVETTPSRSAMNSAATMQQLGYNPTNYNQQGAQYYDQQGTSYAALPPLSAPTSYSNAYMSQQAQPVQDPYSPQRWVQQGGEQSSTYSEWNSPSLPSATLPTSVSNLRSSSYPLPIPQSTQQWQDSASSSYVESGNPPQATYGRSLSPSGYAYAPAAGSVPVNSPTSDTVPPPRRRVSPGATREQQYASGGRNSGNRPSGVLKCSSCKATQSPEWRKGPSGKKELCNACGLRYARSRAKKEGTSQAQRRRKEKGGLSKRESATPPTSASLSYSALRRGSYENSTFSTSSAGSASGSDIYPHSAHPVLDGMTPSPSPPASNVNFVHYSPGADNRQSYSTSTNTFYSVPSPLSNPPVVHSHEQHQPPQLPPLGQLSTYAGRMSPMLPSASAMSHTSMPSNMPPSSYERERDRDRDLQTSSLSSESRHSRRSVVTQQ